MKTIKYTYWKDGNYYLGYLNDYPDYQTQGLSKDELIINLKDIGSEETQLSPPMLNSALGVLEN